MKKMRCIVLGICAMYSTEYSAQIKEVRSVIDSISQSGWQKIQPNLDSLSNPVFQKINATKKETIIMNSEMVAPQAPTEIPITPFNLNNFRQEKRWYFYGQNNLHFNQATFSNWNAGGNNSMGVIGKVYYNLSYKNQRHYWENLFQLGYGLVSTEGQSMRKTEDYINIATNYGYELGKNYYLSTGIQLISQFTAGYNYTQTPEPTYEDRISRFMAPGYLNMGVGISYNPNENLQLIFRPINGKFTFVLDPKIQLAGRYGLERDGQSLRTELGAMMNVLYRIKIYKDMNFVNQLNFFSNYVQHPERVDIAYSGVLNMKFNKFISTVVGIDIVYDHDQIQRTQLKQTLGVGITYNLGVDSAPKNNHKKSIKPFVTK